jgi:hypothetical protein
MEEKTNGQRELLTLGQLGRVTDEPVWFSIRLHGGRYVVWGPEEDASIRELMKLDADAEVPGLLIRRWGYPPRAQQERRALRRWSRIGEVPAEEAERIVRESVSEHILVGWRSIAGPDRERLEYTPTNAAAMFEADPDFFDAVVEASTAENAFREQQAAEMADALGN